MSSAADFLFGIIESYDPTIVATICLDVWNTFRTSTSISKFDVSGKRFKRRFTSKLRTFTGTPKHSSLNIIETRGRGEGDKKGDDHQQRLFTTVNKLNYSRSTCIYKKELQKEVGKQGKPLKLFMRRTTLRNTA